MFRPWETGQRREIGERVGVSVSQTKALQGLKVPTASGETPPKTKTGRVSRKPYALMLQWKWRGGHSELYVPSLPPILLPQKGPYPLSPPTRNFLGHCWLHHDNCVINKAFLLGILPFTEEGATVKGGRNKGAGRVDRAKELGWRLK